jgi:hypothetical protein
MVELWMVIAFVAVPLVLGRLLHDGHRRCCGQRRLRLEGTVTIRRLP